MILFNTNENIIAHFLRSIVGTCLLHGLLVDQREMTDPRDMTGWKTDVQRVNANYSGYRWFVTADCL